MRAHDTGDFEYILYCKNRNSAHKIYEFTRFLVKPELHQTITPHAQVRGRRILLAAYHRMKPATAMSSGE